MVKARKYLETGASPVAKVEVANDGFPPNWEVIRDPSNSNVYVRAPNGKNFNSMVKARKYLKEVGANPALSALKPTPPEAQRDG